MEIEFGVRSDVGRSRGNNEDSFAIAAELNLFVLSDGMGGLAAGEAASRLTVETIVDNCRAAASNPSLPLIGEYLPRLSKPSNRLASAIRKANREVYAAAKSNKEKRGMGATVVAVWIVDPERAAIAHVGDSRVYRLRGGEFVQITDDHSFVGDQVRRGLMTQQEAERSNMQSVLLRALGVEPEVQVDLTEKDLAEGDTFLLCSDGLTRELSNAQISATLSEIDNPQHAAEQLIDLANQAGGGDNITAVVVRYAPKPVRAFARIGKWFKGSEQR
ncbi:MAG TPA: Stp1/IreP family PP2C-type Ser/Thr phosphatase [Candidatus Acidoferrales bacterium]|nr:Stp1/IreP family PP2C-type Ser/Thr phosphatase [Candidatus Acidoferrales bacterium]